MKTLSLLWLLLLVLTAGCAQEPAPNIADRMGYVHDVVVGNHQGQACYLKCWGKGYDICDLTHNPRDNYVYNPNDSVDLLMSKYHCKDK